MPGSRFWTRSRLTAMAMPRLCQQVKSTWTTMVCSRAELSKPSLCSWLWSAGRVSVATIVAWNEQMQ